jgi:lipopolysaccharide export system permease protein
MIIRRYIITEIVKPALAILTVLLAVFASYSAVTLLAEAVGGAMPLGTAGRIILFRIGMAIEVLLPTTLYLSVIIALGRLYKDSEMTALAACGVGPKGVIVPVLLLALPVAGLSAFASLYLRPEAYDNIYRLKREASDIFEMSMLESGRFMEIDSGKYTFFAEDFDANHTLARRVFLRTANGDSRQVIIAEEMRQGSRHPEGYRNLLFHRGVVIEFPIFGEGGKIINFTEAQYPLASNNKDRQRYQRKASTTRFLFGSDRLEDIAELQWRLSTPLTTIVLALLGIPLSRTNPRRGNFAKLGIALVIFALYYQLFAVAKTQVENGVVPIIPGIWWVPALLGGFAAWQLWLTARR